MALQDIHKMKQKDYILQELNELKSSLADLAFQNIYTVPNGYFEGLIGQVLNRIKAIETIDAVEELRYMSPLLSNIPKQIPYNIPQGYFEVLEEKLMQTVRESNDYQTVSEELDSLSPLLSGLKKQIPYSVPQGYFESLTQQVNTKTDNPESRIISITSRKWFRLAAAAVITGVIAMAGFIFIKKDSVDPGKNSYGWVKKNTKKVSTEKLEEFVELTEADRVVASSDNKVQNVKDLIKDVPENEIQSLINDTQLLDDLSSETNADEEILMN